MSAHSPDHDAAIDAVDDGERRYAEITVGEDDLVVYDRENPRAWLYSSVAVSVRERR